jgi:hypothetical protein
VQTEERKPYSRRDIVIIIIIIVVGALLLGDIQYDDGDSEQCVRGTHLDLRIRPVPGVRCADVLQQPGPRPQLHNVRVRALLLWILVPERTTGQLDDHDRLKHLGAERPRVAGAQGAAGAFSEASQERTFCNSCFVSAWVASSQFTVTSAPASFSRSQSA